MAKKRFTKEEQEERRGLTPEQRLALITQIEEVFRKRNLKMEDIVTILNEFELEQ